MIFPWLEHDKMDVFIDVKGVREFHELKTTPEGIEIGAAVTITNLRNLLKRLISSEKEPASRTNGFETLHHHLSKVASTNLRNSGTVLGNLMACGSKAFPSDIATPFMVLDATVTLHTGEAFLLEDFLREGNFDGKIVTRISLPYRKEGTFFNVFKVKRSYFYKLCWFHQPTFFGDFCIENINWICSHYSFFRTIDSDCRS